MLSINCDKITLGNGLNVIFHEDHNLPFVAVNIWYHVGSKNEIPGRTGFAHLFEHLMFEGSKNHDRDYFEPLQKVGASINGSTTHDRTNYWENVPSNHLELALWLESDRMGFLLDALDQKRFDIQRDVVKNERRQSYENRPYGNSQLMIQPALFPSPHPYSWSVIGSQEDLDAAQLDDVKDFFRKFYSPSNASLAIAGDFDRSQVEKFIDLYFSNIPSGEPISRIGRMDSSLTGEVSITVYDNVHLPRIYIAWPTCPMFDDHEAGLVVLGDILGGGKSSRLYQKLVYEKQIANDVSVGNFSQEISGEFYIQVTLRSGHSIEEVEELVHAEIAQLKDQGVTHREISRAKNRIESEHISQLEHLGGFGGRADQLNYYNVFAGNPDLINYDLERYLALDDHDITLIAGEYLNDNKVRLEVVPEKSTVSTEIVVDRTIMPTASGTSVYQAPVPSREILRNGLNILFCHKSSVPMVACGLVLRHGGASDPVDLPGLSSMTASMILEGTSSLSSRQLSEEMEFMGSHMSSDVGREHGLVSFEVLSAHWSRAVQIMADMLQNPIFPEKEMERIRAERLSDIERISDDPVGIAHRVVRSLVYGVDDAYGHPIFGSKQSISRVSVGEVIGYYADHYSPEDATLLVVGDLDKDKMVAHLDKQFGSWIQKNHTPNLPKGNFDNVEPQPTTIFLVDKPGAAQSVIRAGQLTIARPHNDFYPMDLLNYIFGGHPTARLFLNLRQDKGYSYGYYSTVDWLNIPSAIFAGGAVQTAVTTEAVIETLKEFKDLRVDRPVEPTEFAAAKDGLLRSFPSRFEGNSQLLMQFSNLIVFDLPDDYYSDFAARIGEVTLDDVRRVAHERIDESSLVVVVVGDMNAIEPGLRQLGFPIKYVSHEGHLFG